MARKMKDSGIEWIGEIPEGWEIKYFVQLFSQVKSKNIGLREKNLLSLSYGKIKQKSIETVGGLLPDNFEGYNIIDRNDIVLRLTDLQNDQHSLRVGLSHERGIITSAYCSIRVRGAESPNYLYYYLHTFDIAKGFYGMGSGVRQGLNWDGLKYIKILLPPQHEQDRISVFLNQKTLEIDSMLSKTISSIEEYKKLKQAVITQAVTKGVRGEREMKDSGVEWIGAIPKDWEIKRLKSFCTIVDCKNRTPDVFPDGKYTVVRTSCIKVCSFSYEGSYQTDTTNFKAWTLKGQPHKGDIFFTREAPVGEACLVPNADNLCMGQRVMFFRPEDNSDARYIMYSIYGPLVREYIASKNSGSTVGHLKLGQVACIPIFYCPPLEQKEIADYLDAKCAEIDRLIAKKEQLVKELEGYKKSLIYEVVTGKREV